MKPNPSKIIYLLFLSVFFFSTCKKDDPTTKKSPTVGSSAHELLSQSPYNSLQIQISYVKGFKPEDQSIENLKTFLNKYLNKPNGITVILNEINSNGDPTFDLDEIYKAEDKSRTISNTGNSIGVHILITDGNYSEDSGNSVVLGIAYKPTSICVFGKTIHDNSGGLGKPSRIKLESNVFLHEFGHLLGLVDIGSAMQKNHKDEAHGSHCINKDCLMYYEAESTRVMSMLMNGNIPDLDADCQNDLKANGGK